VPSSPHGRRAAAVHELVAGKFRRHLVSQIILNDVVRARGRCGRCGRPP
jgi:hypothetical protein